MEKNRDIYKKLMRDKEVIFAGIKSLDKRTRQAMTDMIQTIQIDDRPDHKKEEKLHMMKSLLKDMEDHSKKIEKNDSLLTKIISDYHKERPKKLAIFRKVFDHIKSHQDDFENMSEKERSEKEAELSTSDERLLYRLISLAVIGEMQDTKIFETMLMEIKASYTTGTNVIGLLSQSLVDSKKDIESSVNSTAAYLSALPPNNTVNSKSE